MRLPKALHGPARIAARSAKVRSAQTAAQRENKQEYTAKKDTEFRVLFNMQRLICLILITVFTVSVAGCLALIGVSVILSVGILVRSRVPDSFCLGCPCRSKLTALCAKLLGGFLMNEV